MRAESLGLWDFLSLAILKLGILCINLESSQNRIVELGAFLRNNFLFKALCCPGMFLLQESS